MRMSGWGVGVGGSPTFYVTVSGGSVTKNPSANGGDAGLIPGSGRSPGAGNGNPLQYFWLGSPMDRGAWWAAVHWAAKSQIWLSDSPRVRTHTHPCSAPLHWILPLCDDPKLFSAFPDSSEEQRWRITVWRTTAVKWGNRRGTLLQWQPRKAGLTGLSVV